MTTAAAAPANTHRHVLSYRHGNTSGFYPGPRGVRYGATFGKCDVAGCGAEIVQVCRSGDTMAANRRAFIAVRDLDEAYAENSRRQDEAARAAAAPYVALVAAVEREDEVLNRGWRYAVGAVELEVGQVAWGYSRGRVRQGIITKVGRKNAQLTYTTAGAMNDAARFGAVAPQLSSRTLPADEVIVGGFAPREVRADIPAAVQSVPAAAGVRFFLLEETVQGSLF